MIAFDTDVLTGILLGNAGLVERAAKIPIEEQAVPVIVIEEILRGRLNVIRQAEASRASVNLVRAYELFEQTFGDFRRLHILSYSSEAELHFQQWRRQGFFLRLWQAGLAEYDEMEGIAWEWQSLDGTQGKAPLAQEAVGNNPTDRGKKRHQAQFAGGRPWRPALAYRRRGQSARREALGTDAGRDRGAPP